MTVVVIGKNGQLASEIANGGFNEDFIFLGRSEIDILDSNKLVSTLDKYNPSAIINASAYTNVDKAETDRKSAFELNQLGVENLAYYVSKRNLHLVHISTDYVFAGDKGSPYTFDDEYAPIGIYGASKVAVQGMCGV